MTIIWFIVWFVYDTPDVKFSGGWNKWAIALVVCLALDIFGGSSSQ